MASQLTFGEILAEAREHKGMDVNSAARRLRIRPDILRSIEAEDFSRMPPRGYTRNMIYAYARLVGLNPTEITRMYLDAAYAFQVGKARSDTLPRVSGSGQLSRNRGNGRSRTAPVSDERPLRQNALGRTLYDDRRTFSRGDYDTPARGHQTARTHPSRHAAVPRSQYTNFYAGPQGNAAMQSKLPFVIAGVIILVLLIVILFLIFGPKESQDQAGSTTVPITGLDDTTQSSEGSTDEGSDQTQQQQQLIAPTSVTVEYRVSSSADVYAEISVDGGAAEPTYLAAGTTETVDVTGTWSLATWTTDLVQITVDGDPVEFTQSGTSIPTVTVDYEAYLEQWLNDHPGAIGSQSDTDATETGTTGNTTSGTTSTASSASTGSTSGSTSAALRTQTQ